MAIYVGQSIVVALFCAEMLVFMKICVMYELVLS